jgi:hypothetical protein
VSGAVDTVTNIPVSNWCKKGLTLTNKPLTNCAEAKIQQQHIQIQNMKEGFLNNIKIGAVLGSCHAIQKFVTRQLYFLITFAIYMDKSVFKNYVNKCNTSETTEQLRGAGSFFRS